MMTGRHRVVAKKIVCWLLFHLRQLKEGALGLVLSAEPTWGRVWEGVTLWCSLENALYKIKDHLRNKELHVA